MNDPTPAEAGAVAPDAALAAAPALPHELTIYTVGEWAPRCLAWLAGLEAGSELPVAAARVAEIDSAGVQLLVALANALARRDGRLVLVAPSRPLAEAVTRLGAAFLLEEATTTEAHA